jgi:hypothetical protein
MLVNYIEPRMSTLFEFIRYFRMERGADDLRLQNNFNLARYQFVVTELDLAITFCQIALSADAPPKRKNRS